MRVLYTAQSGSLLMSYSGEVGHKLTVSWQAGCGRQNSPDQQLLLVFATLKEHPPRAENVHGRQECWSRSVCSVRAETEGW